MRLATNTIAGLPLKTAIIYIFLFITAFSIYNILWKNVPIMTLDSGGYIRDAQDLSDFSVDRLHARPPGYALFLAATGSTEKPTRALFQSSLVLHFAAVWLIAVVLYALGITGLWLTAFGFLLVLPPYTEYAAYVLSETLSEFLLVVGFSTLVLWFLRGKGLHLLLISGMAIGYSALTRPTYQALALAVTGFLLVACRVLPDRPFNYGKIVKAGVVLVASSVFFIGGYSLFNYVKFDFFGIYTISGFNLSTRTVKVIERLPDEYAAVREALIKARDAELIKRGDDHTAQLSYWYAIPELVRITGRDGPELSKYMLRVNLLLIRMAPLKYLQEVLASFSGYWLPTATELANMNSLAVQTFWAALQLAVVAVFGVQAVVILGAVIFIFSQRWFLDDSKPHSKLNWPSGQLFAYCLAGTIVLYSAILTSLVEIGDPRYRLPTEPLLIFMCFLGFSLWRNLVMNNHHSFFKTRDA